MNLTAPFICVFCAMICHLLLVVGLRVDSRIKTATINASVWTLLIFYIPYY